jgi:hypothetical protein
MIYMYDFKYIINMSIIEVVVDVGIPQQPGLPDHTLVHGY